MRMSAADPAVHVPTRKPQQNKWKKRICGEEEDPQDNLIAHRLSHR